MLGKAGFAQARLPLIALILLAIGLLATACGGSDATPTPAVRFGEFVTAKGVDGSKGNAPVNPTNTFGRNDRIYAVAQVQHFPQGHRVFARWMVPSQVGEDTGEITADRDYSNTYLEFHIGGEAGQQLATGRYTVQLYVDGNPGPRTEFEVR